MFEILKIIEMNEAIYSLAFSDSRNLGVVLNKCAYVFNQNGNLLNKVCGNNIMKDVSYCCGKFGFVNWDDYAYITDENGKLIKKVHVGKDYDNAITMIKDGFVACEWGCAFFDFNGNKKWDLGVGGVSSGPSYYKGYWYVADWYWKELLIVKDGNVINKINNDKSAESTAVCGKHLAVSTETHLYLYDISNPTNPKELWNVGGFNGAYQVTFSSNCKYIAVADKYNKKLKFFNIEGDLIFEKKYGSKVLSVAWKDDRIAVGTETDLFVYSTLPLHCFI